MIGIGQKNSEKIAKQMMILCLKQHLQPKSLYIKDARLGISSRATHNLLVAQGCKNRPDRPGIGNLKR